jgi:hypothetical protein
MKEEQKIDIERKYKGWLYWLRRIGFHRRIWKEDVILDPESWRTYFDEGFRPGQALTEDLKNA